MRHLALISALTLASAALGQIVPVIDYASISSGGHFVANPLSASQVCADLTLSTLSASVDGGSFGLSLWPVDPLNPSSAVGPAVDAGFTSPTAGGVALCGSSGAGAWAISWSVAGYGATWGGVTLSLAGTAAPGVPGPTGPTDGWTCLVATNDAGICDSLDGVTIAGPTGAVEGSFSPSGLATPEAAIAGCMSLGGGGIGLCNGSSVAGSAGGNIVLQPVDGGVVMAPGVTFPNGAFVSGDTGPGDLILAAVDGGIAGIVGSAASGPAVSLSSAGTMSSGHIVDMSNNGTTVATIDYAGTIGQNGNSVKLWAGSGLPWNFTNNTSPATGDLFGWYDGATEVASLSPVGDLHASSSLSSAGEIYAGTYADLDGGAFVGDHPGYIRSVHAFSVVLPSVSVAAQSATATAEITSSTVSCGSSCGTTPCLCDASATCATCVATVTAAPLASLQAQAGAIKQGDTCSVSNGNWSYGPLVPYSLGGGMGVNLWNITSGAQTFPITNEVIECNGH